MMDEKKVREAIELMKKLKKYTDIWFGVSPMLEGKEKEAKKGFDIAIKALEKQLPKKGIKEKITEGANKGLHKYYCPICYEKGDLSNKCNVGDYCSDCGQRIDWSEYESGKMKDCNGCFGAAGDDCQKCQEEDEKSRKEETQELFEEVQHVQRKI